MRDAVLLAQSACSADRRGDLTAALRLYGEAVDLIAFALANTPEPSAADASTFMHFSHVYSKRIAELKAYADVRAGPTSSAAGGDAAAEGATAANKGGGSFFFAFEDDAVLKAARLPEPAPVGANEWRRPFWLMRILRSSMQHGGYLTPDGRVFVPRRLWTQRGAKFLGLAAKHECATCLLAEFVRCREIDYRQRSSLQSELDRLCDTLDAVQSTLHRLLPFVPEARSAHGPADERGAVGKLTERFKGLAKTLDKTAARVATLPTKCADPTDYIGARARVPRPQHALTRPPPLSLGCACSLLSLHVDTMMMRLVGTRTHARFTEARCARRHARGTFRSGGSG